MVAHIVGLKLLLLRNALRRSVAQLIGLALAVLYGLGVLALAVAGLVALRFAADPAVAVRVVTILGCLFTLGWGMLPLLSFGVDQTLDPSRFATYSVPRRRLLAGMLCASLIGVPGAFAVVLSATTVITWSRSVLAVVVAVVAAPVALLTCIVLSRCVTSALAAGSQSRRGRELVSGVFGIVLIAAVIVLPQLGESLAGGASWPTVATALGWTPFGWAWSAPARVSQGDVGVGLVQLVLAAGFVVVLLALCERLLTKAVLDPRGRSSGSGSRAEGLGFFGRLPGTPAGAVGARSATYYRRDPRYLVSLGLMPLVPLVLLVPALQGTPEWVLGMGPMAAFLLGYGVHNDIAYDGTAFWMHVSAGVRGRADLLGRALPLAALCAVLIPAYVVGSCWYAGRWDALPAVMGGSVILLMGGWGVSFVVGVLKPYPVAQSDENPFSSPPGAMGAGLVSQLIASSATFVLALPVLIPAGLALWRYPALGWASLVLAPVLGIGYVLAGLRFGGSIYDRRSAELLGDLRKVA